MQGKKGRRRRGKGNRQREEEKEKEEVWAISLYTIITSNLQLNLMEENNRWSSQGRSMFMPWFD